MILPLNNPATARSVECSDRAAYYRDKATETQASLFGDDDDFTPIKAGGSDVDRALRQAIERKDTGRWRRFTVLIPPCEHDQEEATVHVGGVVFECHWVGCDEDSGELEYEVDRNGTAAELERYQ